MLSLSCKRSTKNKHIFCFLTKPMVIIQEVNQTKIIFLTQLKPMIVNLPNNLIEFNHGINYPHR